MKEGDYLVVTNRRGKRVSIVKALTDKKVTLQHVFEPMMPFAKTSITIDGTPLRKCNNVRPTTNCIDYTIKDNVHLQSKAIGNTGCYAITCQYRKVTKEEYARITAALL